MIEIAFIIGAFVVGSLPFSVWIGRYGLKKDIRAYGDGNPGSTNVLRAGGLTWGGLALFLDLCKGAVPVGLANTIFNIDGLPLVLIAAMPPLGHAFSPFLGFRGGKAIASVVGAWIGLTLGVVGLVWCVMLVYWYFTLKRSGWAVVLTAFSVFAYLVIVRANAELFAVWILHLALLVYKHRAEFSRPPFSPVELNRDSASHAHSDHHRNHHTA